MSTTSDILSNGTNTTTSVERIRDLQQRINEETEVLKTQLARQLDKAVETLNILQSLNVVNPLAEPQFYEQRQVLGIVCDIPIKEKGTRKPRNSTAANAIKQYMKEHPAATINDIATGANIHASTVYNFVKRNHKQIKKDFSNCPCTYTLL